MAVTVVSFMLFGMVGLVLTCLLILYALEEAPDLSWRTIWVAIDSTSDDIEAEFRHWFRDSRTGKFIGVRVVNLYNLDKRIVARSIRYHAGKAGYVISDVVVDGEVVYG